LDEIALAELLPDLQRGDERAFKHFFSITYQPLFRKVYHLLKNREAADEIVQELFVRIWQHRATLNDEEKIAGYLFTIAKNLVYDYYRKIAKDRRLAAYLLENAAEHYLHTDILLENKESRQILLKAMDALPAQRREVFRRCKIEGQSYEEAAHDLGLSPATINRHMTQAMRQMREFLLKNYNTGAVLIATSIVSVIKEFL
jgi:RNA polymerase sigma-70 factor (ECF subfamily)